MSTSSRSSILSPLPLKIRKRANTRVLLGEEYPSNPGIKGPETLLPPSNDTDYTEKRIHEGLIYAETMLLKNSEPGRRISPLGIAALRIYKEACARLLDLEDVECIEGEEKLVEEMKIEWLSGMRTYEKSLVLTNCLNATNSATIQDLQGKLVLHQKYTFYARYGDMLGEACKQLRVKAETRKVLGWGSFKSCWTEIYDKLEDEQPFYERVRKGEKVHGRCPTIFAIKEACQGVGFDYKDMAAIIRHYANRDPFSNPIPAKIPPNHYPTNSLEYG